MGDLDGALNAYERALQHNFQSITAMNAISCILRTKENFPRAVEYLQGILKLDQNNGEVWGSLGNYHKCSARNAVLTIIRTLLLDDGRPSTSVRRISASPLPPPRPQGKLDRPIRYSSFSLRLSI